MKNDEIIEAERSRLIAAGLLKDSEEIHTFECWKSMGFHVRSAEKAVVKIPIWKVTKRGDREIIFRKKAAFFSSSQVEKN